MISPFIVNILKILLPAAMLFIAPKPISDAGASPLPAKSIKQQAAVPKFGSIPYNSDGFVINGKRRMLLIGTLEYFRIDPTDWDRWLKTFEESGYNTIDCLVPWNFHEPLEGQFDFTSPTHDLARFLQLCQKHNLLVFLRAGSYICNEWDGGGFPAWLVPKNGIEIRQNSPLFLSYVEKYTRALDAIVKPYQITHGGPIILYQIENELDYFPCKDRTGYLNALRDVAITDKITVPLTACVGWRGIPINGATGRSRDVLPTANFYVSGAVERFGLDYVKLLQKETFTNGSSMSNVPPICSETGRDENTLRRLLASGLKGIAPFNFAGGSNFLTGNGQNDWSKPTSYVATSVDFGGMIGFDGGRRPNWYTSRRLAGFVNTFSDALCRARAATNVEGRFQVSNPELGAEEQGTTERKIYSLVNPGSSERFTFLWNNTGKEQPTTLTVDGLTFPRKSKMVVPPWYDLIVPTGILLDGKKLMINYSTAEIYSIKVEKGVRHITLVGEEDKDAEFCITGVFRPSIISSMGEAPNSFKEHEGLTVWFTTGKTRSINIKSGDEKLQFTIRSRQEMDKMPPEASAPMNLLKDGEWRQQPLQQKAETPAWQSTKSGDSGPPFMEAAGILHGVAEYHSAFDWIPGTAKPKVLRVEHAGDIVSAYLNGKFLSTVCAVGAETVFPIPEGAMADNNSLTFRTEIWGHSNFEQATPPSMRLNSPRGIWGVVKLDSKPIESKNGWQIRDITPAVPQILTGGKVLPNATDPGQTCLWECKFKTNSLALKQGLVLKLEGKNLLLRLFVNEHPLGRAIFGPAGNPHITAGPGNEYYIPPAWLTSSDSRLSIVAFSTASGAELTMAELREIVK